jgi:hypothetical protein
MKIFIVITNKLRQIRAVRCFTTKEQAESFAATQTGNVFIRESELEMEAI